MTTQPKMFRINPDTKDSQPIQEVEFARLGFRERHDIQEWVAANPSILGEDLLIIGKEFSGFDRTNERLDLLAIDSTGVLVIIELKRDDTGADAHWQAIKYASYLSRATADDLINMLSAYEKIPQGEAGDKILVHLNADDLNSLNHSQRVILASHRFGPEVTSASLWLNDQAEKDLITCVQLIPYHDANTDSLYLQASTIIPLTGAETYQVGIGAASQEFSPQGKSNLARIMERNRNDEVTRFVREVEQLTLSGLSPEISPDKHSRWAGVSGKDLRYYMLWSSNPPWGTKGMSYRFHLWPTSEPGTWSTQVCFIHNGHDDGRLAETLKGVVIHPEQNADNNGISVRMGTGALDDADFRNRMAETMRVFIETITPIVNDYVDESNAEDI